MKAIELTGTVDDRGNLSLDEPIQVSANSRVRVIILCSEESLKIDPDDTPIEEVKASLRRALEEAKSEQRIPISQMWESIDLQK
jgi:virulence-associated protein VagC